MYLDKLRKRSWKRTLDACISGLWEPRVTIYISEATPRKLARWGLWGDKHGYAENGAALTHSEEAVADPDERE